MPTHVSRSFSITGTSRPLPHQRGTPTCSPARARVFREHDSASRPSTSHRYVRARRASRQLPPTWISALWRRWSAFHRRACRPLTGRRFPRPGFASAPAPRTAAAARGSRGSSGHCEPGRRGRTHPVARAAAPTPEASACPAGRDLGQRCPFLHRISGPAIGSTDRSGLSAGTSWSRRSRRRGIAPSPMSTPDEGDGRSEPDVSADANRSRHHVGPSVQGRRGG